MKKIGPARWRKDGLKALLQGADADQRCHSPYDHVRMGVRPGLDGVRQELGRIDGVSAMSKRWSYSYSLYLFCRHAARADSSERRR